MADPGVETTNAGLRLCDFIQARRQEVLVAWERRVRAYPVARHLSVSALRDHVPYLLDRIALVIRGVHTGRPEPLGDLPDKHALERLEAGYDLHIAARELGELRDTILELWEREAAGAITIQEVRRLDQAIDEVLAISLDRFARARERTLRALERVSSVSFSDGDLDTFLHQLMSVVLETVAAVDSVVLLLRDEQDVLHVRAALGLGERSARGFSPRVGEGFAGEVAKRKEPLLLRDATSDPRVLNPALRGQGIHALYGVPLLHAGGVIGVVHMGSRTAFEFSVDDQQLLRAMAQRATALIVQAQLAERLRLSEARLQAFIDQAPAAIYVKDPDGHMRVANRRMEAIFQSPRGALLGKSDYDILPRETADALRAHDGQVLQSGRPLAVEEVLPLEDGPHTYFSVKFLLPDEQGGPGALCGISMDITERKRVEAALRESEERFRLLVEGVEDHALLMLDPRGHVVSWSPGAERLKGYKADEVLGTSFARFYPPEDVAAGVPEAALREAFERGRHEMEGPLVRKDGSRFWAHMALTALKDDAGHLRGYAKVTRDLSVRRRMEEALRETSERLTAILDTAVDGIITIDEQAIILSVNPATTRIFGYRPEEMVGRNVSMLMPEPDWSQHDTSIRNDLRTGERKVIGIGREVLGKRKDGSVFPLELSVSETVMPGGRFFTGLVRDITLRKTAQQAQALLVEAGTLLAQSLDLESTLHSLATLAVEHLTDYCMVDLLGEDGQLHRQAAHARDPAGQELARRLMEFPPRPGSASPLARVLETGQPSVEEVTPEWLDAAARDAEHRALLERLSPRSAVIVPLVARGRRLGMMTLASTSPGRMSLPAVLEVAKALADRAAIAIDNARLYREAQDAVRVREDVVAIVSHDLRNPLNAISLASLSLLRHDPLTEAQSRGLRRIVSAADRAHRMIRDLLDFTQARAGGAIPIHPRPVDLHELTRQVVDEVQLANPGRHISVEARGDGHGDWDEDRLAQLITNLVGNALQHSPDGTPVRVFTRAEERGVSLRVHNTGAPIPPDLLPVIFEPYRRGPAAALGRGSIGLGLYISRQIVLGHGGHVDVRSSSEEGTTFTVWLPRKPAPVVQ